MLALVRYKFTQNSKTSTKIFVLATFAKIGNTCNNYSLKKAYEINKTAFVIEICTINPLV